MSVLFHSFSKNEQLPDTGGGVLEVLRTLRFADPLLDTTSQLTFAPGDLDPDADWLAWLDQVFYAGLHDILTELLAAAVIEHAHDLLTLDSQIDDLLPPAAAVRSRILGWKLIHDFLPPRGARALGKLREWSISEGRSLHFHTVFATRCGVFNLPLSQVTIALLYKEWHCGFEGNRPLGCTPKVAHHLAPEESTFQTSLK